MCQFKSAIILKDRVFVTDCDSHEDMLAELGIKDNLENAETQFIRAELRPKNGDAFSDIESWKFVVDQDILPDWYVKDYDKQRMIAAVKKWAADHIHIGVGSLIIDSGAEHYIKDCNDVRICSNAKVKSIKDCKNVQIRDDAKVNSICGNTTVRYICGNTTVNYITGKAIVELICDNVKVENICSCARVKIIEDSARIMFICDDARVETIRSNAIVDYIAGNAIIEDMYDRAIIDRICNSATVEHIYGSAIIKTINDDATIKIASEQAIIITSQYEIFSNKNKLMLLENAVLMDRFDKVIYQRGDFKVVKDE